MLPSVFSVFIFFLLSDKRGAKSSLHRERSTCQYNYSDQAAASRGLNAEECHETVTKPIIEYRLLGYSGFYL